MQCGGCTLAVLEGACISRCHISVLEHIRSSYQQPFPDETAVSLRPRHFRASCTSPSSLPHPLHPFHPHLFHAGKTVFTSDHALKLEWVPDWIAIVGSGYIGLEFSDVYTALGSEVGG